MRWLVKPSECKSFKSPERYSTIRNKGSDPRSDKEKDDDEEDDGGDEEEEEDMGIDMRGR
jgi:hypothetical protein